MAFAAVGLWVLELGFEGVLAGIFLVFECTQLGHFELFLALAKSQELGKRVDSRQRLHSRKLLHSRVRESGVFLILLSESKPAIAAHSAVRKLSASKRYLVAAAATL